MQDTIVNAMLSSNIDELKNYCLTNKLAYINCKSTEFWLEKFENDNLPYVGETPTSINAWIERYKTIKNLKHTAQDIIMINKIETKRNEALNLIRIVIRENTYDLIKDVMDEDYNNEFIYDITITKKLNGYKTEYVKINIEDGDMETVDDTLSYNDVVYLMVYVMYYDKDYEILDEQSNPFLMTDTDMAVIAQYSEEDRKNAYKRIGIIEALNELY